MSIRLSQTIAQGNSFIPSLLPGVLPVDIASTMSTEGNRLEIDNIENDDTATRTWVRNYIRDLDGTNMSV